jgi:tRNA dimethylallyltransferase
VAPHITAATASPIVIAGPTASGKSDLALRCAQYLGHSLGVEAEIINADSIQLYDELKILTAYPSDDALSQVRHHLYGILAPHEISSMNFWLDLASAKIQQLHQENKTAIICGGTGLYINALLSGISDIPPIPSDFRDKVYEKFQQLGRDAFFELLKNLDPNLCQTLHQNNTQRILRAYEVVSYTQKPLSEWWKEDGRKKNIGYAENISPIVLAPPRDKLVAACKLRLEKMMAAGAVCEVEQFAKKHPLYAGPLCNVIGYREILSLLEGKISFQNCMELMLIKTRQYAKRQSTWFRHQLKYPKIIPEFGQAIEDIENFLEKITFCNCIILIFH